MGDPPREPLPYAQPAMDLEARRSRRLRREAAKLGMMAGALAAVGVVLFVFDITHSPRGEGTGLASGAVSIVVFAGMFAIASVMQWARSRSSRPTS